MLKIKYRSSTVVIQKYIERPLLYRGRKFDIRLWVMLTHKMDVYVFKEGHLKASSLPYNLSDISSFIHLTNYSVQKYCDNFSKFEEGNEISFNSFQKFLDSNEYTGEKTSVANIYSKICEVVKVTMQCCKDKINAYDRKHCFEIFGYDFMIDEELKPYLLEINTNPGLEESSDLIRALVPRMIDDALRLTIDNMFHTEYSFDTNNGYKTPYPVINYSDQENLWDYICSIGTNREAERSPPKKK